MSAQLEREGVVLAAVAAGERARLRLKASATCAGCACRSACAADEAHEQIVTVRLRDAVRAGDRVRLQLPESALPLAALLGYLLPVICLLGGAVLFGQVSDADAAPVLGALGGLTAGLLLVRRIARLPLVGALQALACHVAEQYRSPPPVPEEDA